MLVHVWLVSALLVSPLQTGTSKPAAKLSSIAGMVVKTADGQPLRKAKITLNAERPDPNTGKSLSYSVTTESDGAFSVADVQPGRYELSVERSGYLLDRKSRRLHTLTLEPGQTMSNLVISMLGAGVITGIVMDKDGDPVQGAEIAVLQRDRTRPSRFEEVGESTKSNDRGEYRIYQLAPGNYYVVAKPPRPPFDIEQKNGEGESATYLVSTYYPGTIDAAQAESLQVRPDDETRADITLTSARTFSIRGKVSSRRPDLAQNVAIFVHGSGELGARGGAEPNEKGEFEIANLPPGNYVLLAAAAAMNDPTGKSTATAHTKVKVVDADMDGVRLNLEPTRLKISGQVIVEGSPAPEASQLALLLQPVEDEDDLGDVFGMGGGMTHVNRDGTFTLENVEPGSYRALVAPMAPNNRPFFTKSIRLGSKELKAGKLTIGTSGSIADLLVIVSAAWQVIEGAVVDDAAKPVVGALVCAIAEAEGEPAISAGGYSASDQRGRFVVTVAPGNYNLVALDRDDDEDACTRDLVHSYPSKATKFHASENGRDTLTLKVIETTND